MKGKRKEEERKTEIRVGNEERICKGRKKNKTKVRRRQKQKKKEILRDRNTKRDRDMKCLLV